MVPDRAAKYHMYHSVTYVEVKKEGPVINLVLEIDLDLPTPNITLLLVLHIEIPVSEIN